MKPVPVIRYTDELYDDFSAVNGRIVTRKVDGKYRYIRKSPLWHGISFVLYRVLATPLAYLYCRIKFGVRFKNRRALRRIKGGYFLYGNHTQCAADAFIPSLISFPKRCCVVTGPDAVSIPVVRHLAPMLGCIPLASTPAGKANFLEVLSKKLGAGCAVAIYPEAHIWPFYNKIRPYPDSSFAYPVKLRAPTVGFVVTYRQRRIFKKRPPLITVTVSEPVYPDSHPAESGLHQEIHRFMAETAERERSFEYIRYEKEE